MEKRCSHLNSHVTELQATPNASTASFQMAYWPGRSTAVLPKLPQSSPETGYDRGEAHVLVRVMALSSGQVYLFTPPVLEEGSQCVQPDRSFWACRASIGLVEKLLFHYQEDRVALGKQLRTHKYICIHTCKNKHTHTDAWTRTQHTHAFTHRDTYILIKTCACV